MQVVGHLSALTAVWRRRFPIGAGSGSSAKKFHLCGGARPSFAPEKTPLARRLPALLS